MCSKKRCVKGQVDDFGEQEQSFKHYSDKEICAWDNFTEIIIFTFHLLPIDQFCIRPDL